MVSTAHDVVQWELDNLQHARVAADAPNKVNYFEMANNLRTLKVGCSARGHWNLAPSSLPYTDDTTVYVIGHERALIMGISLLASSCSLSSQHDVLLTCASTATRLAQEVLLKLESLIAALPMGQDGFTAPGAFIFELLAKVNLKEDTFGFMLQLLDQAMDLLSDEALAAGRK